MIFIDPCAPRRQKALEPKRSPVKAQIDVAKTWHDFAHEEKWEEAIVHRLRDRSQQAYLLWRVVNEVVAESVQPGRPDIRWATKQVLRTLTTLRKERRLFIWKRRYLVGLDLDEQIISLEEYRKLRSGQVQKPEMD